MDDQSAFATASQPAAHRYEQAIDHDADASRARLVGLVGPDARVLVLGTDGEDTVAALADMGCTVVAIAGDASTAAACEAHAERVLVGELEDVELESELGDDRFDVVLAADVLQRLRDPVAVLRRLRPRLVPGGCFVISVPNVGHAEARLSLLEGRFPDGDSGPLGADDRRFFTRDSLTELIDDADLTIAELYRHAQATPPAEVAAEIRRLVADTPEAETYRFLLRAVPLPADGLREVQRRMRELAEVNADLRATAQAPQLSKLRAALIEAHEQMLRRDVEIERLRVELDEARAREVIAQLRLDRLLSTAPARVYRRLSSMPGMGAVRNARTAAFQRAVQRAQGPARHG